MIALRTGHIGLNVTDLQRSKAFYQAVFNFEVAGESLTTEKGYVFLTDGTRLVLTLWPQSDGRFGSHRPGLHHLAFEVDDIEDVQRIEKKVRHAGVKLYHDGIVKHGEGVSSGGIFFEDPDGIRLEVYAPKGITDQPAPSGEAPTCGFF